ncbi:hypothetical protein [Maribellus mangrovi]|uniref:hypothetical protein n=1 Tax=Maribellus mangrovi TaxID=3133146 RepID=UPI0030ED9676
MRNCRHRYLLILTFLLLGFGLKAQEPDTVIIRFDQILVLPDTSYFGVNDSMIIIEKGTEFEVIKNFLVRKPSYYKRKPHKVESARRLNAKYGRILMGEIYDSKDNLPEEFNPADNYYSIYQNRVVKSIQIERVAVLDGNVFDTANVKTTGVGRFLNSTYQPTRERVVKNNLKFRENDLLNPRIFSDNERLLRDLSYIEDARIQVMPVENSMDSITVLVVVKDRYPIGIGGKINDYNAFEIEPYSRNFLGMGHNLGAIFEFDGSTDEKFGYGAYYGVDNIGGSFFNGEVSYSRGLDKDYFGVTLSKPFVTTYTRFGGELHYEKITEKIRKLRNVRDSLIDRNDMYSANLVDMWMGYSFLFQYDNKHPFLNIAGRYYYKKFTDHPDIDYENNYPFHDNQAFLASLSFQQVSYIKTTKLVQYGPIEDIPVGINASITGGWQHTSFVDRPYAGARLNYGIFFQNAGIFSTSADFGMFRYKSKFEDVINVLKLAYASPLTKVGNLELRNLFQVTFNAVYNPRYLIPVLYTDYLMARDSRDGFYGNQNFAVNYHPIFYTNYNLWGFRFSVDPFVDFGWINQAIYEDNKWDRYTRLGLNLSTKNESLIFPAMHIQLAYYIDAIPQKARFKFKLMFKDIKLLKKFTELKPRIAEAIR